jgi:hypothetical protein
MAWFLHPCASERTQFRHVREVASSIRATQITRFRAMPTVKVGSQVVDHIGG